MKGSIKDKFLLILGAAFLVTLLALLVVNILRNGIFSNNMGMNVVVIGENEVSLLLLRPEEQMVNWVDLPNDIRVKIYNSTADYPLRSLWSYGVSEKKPYETIEKSLGQAMGVALPRVIKLDKGDKLEDVLGSLLSVGLKSDLSLRDRGLIRQFLAEAVKSKKVLELNVPDSVFDKETDPDGKDFLSVDNAIMSLWTKNKFVLVPILNESADISIDNVSDTEGLGLTLSRQLESAGMHVIEVKADKTMSVSGNGCFYQTEKNYSMTETFLREQVGCKKIEQAITPNHDRIEIWVK
jgi:hypothetical protein